jgi:hypothetical protein
MAAWSPNETGLSGSGAEGYNGTNWQWSRWEASDMDGKTREGEHSGKKANQAVT